MAGQCLISLLYILSFAAIFSATLTAVASTSATPQMPVLQRRGPQLHQTTTRKTSTVIHRTNEASGRLRSAHRPQRSQDARHKLSAAAIRSRIKAKVQSEFNNKVLTTSRKVGTVSPQHGQHAASIVVLEKEISLGKNGISTPVPSNRQGADDGEEAAGPGPQPLSSTNTYGSQLPLDAANYTGAH